VYKLVSVTECVPGQSRFKFSWDAHFHPFPIRHCRAATRVQVTPADEGVISAARRTRAKASHETPSEAAVVAGKPATGPPQAPNAVFGVLWMHVIRGDHLRCEAISGWGRVGG
jgi:hypothetical protein